MAAREGQPPLGLWQVAGIPVGRAVFHHRRDLPVRVVGLARDRLVGSTEAVGHADAGQPDQLGPAMGYIASRRAAAGLGPVDDAGTPAPGPEHVAGMEIAVKNTGR